MGSTSGESKNLREWLQVLRHLPEIRERDGAILWTTLVKECSNGFHETVTWIFDDWKPCLAGVTNKIRFGYCHDE